MLSEDRPRSPSIQIYRPQLTSVLSFTHRLTGIALSVGSLVLVAWLVAGSIGASAYDLLLRFLRSWVGLALLFGWTFALFFHLCNGIRHLYWDAVLGFELKTIYASGWIVIATASLLTIASWLAALFMMRPSA